MDKRIEELCVKIAALEVEIHNSRELNTEQHDNILTHAELSAHLAEEIAALKDGWNTFWGIIKGVRTVVFTVSFMIAMAYFIAHWADFFTVLGA